MRKKFVFILWFPVFLQAQTYIPFPKDSTIWSQTILEQDFITNPPFPPIQCIQTTHYGLFGDTTIRGTNYSKLYKSVNIPDFDLQTADYLGCLREDTIKRVYFLFTSDSVEYLMYDFNLRAGDTACIVLHENPYIQCLPVSRADSTFFEGKFRRTITLENGHSLDWIEGVGSSAGLFEFPYPGSFYWYLTCFRQHVQLPVNANNCSCSNTYWPGVAEVANLNFMITPSITSGKITIEFREFSGTYNLKINSLLGQNVYELNNNDRNVSTIDLSTLSSGIYIAVIETQQGIRITRKIIKN